jgi:hypothetical protein
MAGVIEEAAFTDALVKELCSGRKLMEQKQPFREIEAAKEAAAMRGHKALPGLGKCVLNIPAHEFFLIREKYGDDAFGDRGFIRDFQRLEPTMAVNKA